MNSLDLDPVWAFGFVRDYGFGYDLGHHSRFVRGCDTDEGTGTKPGVPGVPKYLSESENESCRDSGDDDNDDDSNETDSDKDENLNLNHNDDEEEEKQEEYVRTPGSFEFNDDDEEYDDLYKVVNVRSKAAEHEEVRKGDAEMADTTHESASQEKSYEQVIEDAHVTLTSSQKTKGLKQSSSISSDFASKFLNLDNVPPVIDEVASMMNVKTPHEESSTQAPSNLLVPVTTMPKTSTFHVTTITPIIQPFSSIPQMTTPTPVPTTKLMTSSIPALPDFASLFGFNQRVSALEQGLSQVKQVYHSAQILAQIPTIVDEHLTDSDQGLKKKKTKGKDSELQKLEIKRGLRSSLSKGLQEASKHDWFKKLERPPTPDRDWNAGKQIDFRPPQTWISKMAKAGKPPTTFDKLMSTPINFSAYVLHNLKIENLTQEHLVGPAFILLKRTCKSRVELEFHFEEWYKAVTDKLDWTNPKGYEYLFDLSKPLPLIKDQGRQVVHVNYFFNNDLEYLKGGSLSSKYTTSTTKTKAAKYDTIEGIEDMVPML
ncbi:hypothetical protein Tco_0672917 [Tanacetum coccineum]